MCLVCGTVVCSHSYCCQVNITHPFQSETLGSRANKRFRAVLLLRTLQKFFLSPGRAGWSKCRCLHKSCQQVRLWHRSLPQVYRVDLSLGLKFSKILQLLTSHLLFWTWFWRCLCRVRECKVVMFSGRTKGCFESPPYLDQVRRVPTLF